MGKENVKRMYSYGQTEEEKAMNLQAYNHALFQNNVFFMQAVWEINMLTGTVVVLCDKREPEKGVYELVYEDIFRQYLAERIMEEEQDYFRQYMEMENLAKLTEEIFFDVKLREKNGDWDLHRIVLTPAFDENGVLYCVYAGSRNLQTEVSRELAEYHNQEQFRDALIVNCYFYADYDLDGDGMLDQDFETPDGISLISRMTGRKLPVPFETFIQKWFELHDPGFDKADGREIFTAEYLKHSFSQGNRLINMEVKQKLCDADGMPEALQVFIILMQDIADGHIHAHIIWRDVSAFHKKAVEDNRKLEDSNQLLRRTISQEKQFRQSVLSGSILWYEINLTKNQIEEEFYETVDGKQYPMLELMGLTAPCSFDEFCRRWSEERVSEESREIFLQIYNRQYMLDAYERGERQLELEFDTVLARGIRLTLRNTALLVEDNDSGDIIAMMNSRDVTARRQEQIRQREVLMKAYETANRASQAKSEFLARISYDIRTPMNSIIGMTAIAEQHQDNTERVNDCLKRISRSGKYLLGLVDEMLDMSMIESGRMEFKEGELDLEEQFENLCVLLQSQVEDKEHEFTASIEPLEHRTAFGDRRRIDQVIMSLVDNAVKYTTERGRISLTLREKRTANPGIGCYEYVVEDSGIGMEPEFQERMFDPFVRAKDRRVEKIPGSGLGLAITQNIVRMMDGTIEVKSEPEKGTKVTVTIFLRLPGTSGTYGDVQEMYNGRRILVVEDNESNADILSEILRMFGLETEHLWNGKEAVDRLAVVEDGYYDMIFMDIVMPVMDGHEAATEIRSVNRDYTRELPIISMSANSDEKDVQTSLEVGMNAHLTKPIDINALKRVLRDFLTERKK